MYLKRFELQGFKSFATRTVLELQPGITAIVGPNGSGKSNLADAIRWVLGEQSLRLLRGKKAHDVIWSGTAARPAVGMAEVHLTLDNSDSWLDIPFAEVTISRRALRGGDTDYFINRSRVRLRDISDLLAKGAAGAGGYGLSVDRAVLGQGAVDAILSMRPSDRMSAFEDAAGVRPYYHQRDDAIGRVDAAKENVRRLQDIVAEIAPRLPQLQRAADRARQHAALQQEFARVTARLYRRQLGLLLDERAHAEAESVQAASRATTARVAYDELSARLSAAERVVEAHEDRVHAAQVAYAEVNQRHQAAAAMAQVAQARCDGLRGEAAGLVTRLDETVLRAHSADDELHTRTELLAQREAALREQHARVHELREQLAVAQRQLAPAEQAVARYRQQAAAIERTVELQRREHALAKQRAETVEQEAQAAEATSAELQQQRARLEPEMQRAETAAKAAQRALDRLEEGGRRLRERARAAQLAVDAARARHDARVNECTRASARRDTLRDVQQSLAGAGDGPRLLWSRRKEIGCLHGPMAGLIATPPGMERAAEAALGDAFDALVAVDAATAQRGIELAHRHEHAAVVISRQAPSTVGTDDARDHGATIAAAVGVGWVGAATDLFVAKGGATPTLARLLAACVVVRDLPAAHTALETALRIAPAVPWRAVTLTGIALDTFGMWSCTGKGTNYGAIERTRELQTLDDQLVQLDSGLRAEKATLERTERDAAEVAVEMARIEPEIRAAQREQRTTNDSLRAVQQKSDRLHGEETARERERQRMLSRLDTAHEQLAICHTIDPSEEVRLAAAREAVRSAEEAAHIRRRDVSSLLQRQQSLQVQLASAEGQLSAERSIIATLAQAAQTQHLDREKLCRRRDELVPQIAELSRIATEQLANRELERERIASLGQAVDQEKAALATNRAQLAVDRQSEPALRQRWNAALLHEQSASGSLQRSRQQCEVLIEQIRDELGVEPEALAALPEDASPVDALRSRRLEIAQRMRQLGQINPDAITEHEALSTRHRFLIEQIGDVTRAVEELMALIAHLEVVIERQFLQVFTRTADAFARYFGLLFPGGEGALSLERGGDEGARIEITVRLPGKRRQDLALLSGGERAMVAVTLLLAMTEARPTPFCLLDEADAALDEPNVERFGTLLRGLSDRTQFLLVTHNRGTVQAAGALYGVSMGADGASRVLSIGLQGRVEVGATASTGHAPTNGSVLGH